MKLLDDTVRSCENCLFRTESDWCIDDPCHFIFESRKSNPELNNMHDLSRDADKPRSI
jgi:hypothetical protein